MLLAFCGGKFDPAHRFDELLKLGMRAKIPSKRTQDIGALISAAMQIWRTSMRYYDSVRYRAAMRTRFREADAERRGAEEMILIADKVLKIGMALWTK